MVKKTLFQTIAIGERAAFSAKDSKMGIYSQGVGASGWKTVKRKCQRYGEYSG